MKNITLSTHEKEMLEWFAGSRQWDENIAILHEKLKENVICELYRGLPFQEQLIKKGTVIEEWYGSSHWTTDENIARNFSKDYISEGLIEEIMQEQKLSEDAAYELFVPLIMHLDGAEGVPLYEYVSCFEHEKEINIHGSDFIIHNVWKEGEIYHVNVKEVNQTIE